MTKRPKIRIKFIASIAATLVLLSAAAVSHFILAERAMWLPDDFSYKAKVLSTDNFYNDERNVFQGIQNSKTDFSFTTKESSNNTLLLHNVFDVKSESGEQLVKIERDYSVDRTSGKHVAGGDKQRTGYLFAPRNLVKNQDFTYWHVNYDTPIDMKYVAAEKISGLETYKYDASFDVDQTKELSFLPDVGAKYGMILHVKLDLWVEPQTGRLINYVDRTEANYYSLATEKEVKPWNKFSNTYTQNSVAEQVELANNTIATQDLYATTVPIILIVGAILLLLTAFLSWSGVIRLSPFIIPVIGLVLISLISFSSAESQKQRKTVSVEAKISNFESIINNRFQAYGDALYASQGFYTSSDFVSREEWRTFTQTLNVGTRFPGVEGLGLSLKVGSASDIPEFEKRYRALTSKPDFTVFPKGEQEEHHSIVYLEPESKQNLSAIGFDMYHEATRRKAMQRARDTGSPALSGKVTLVQEAIRDEKQAGFLLYLPLYNKGESTKTENDRKLSHKGYVYSLFRAGDFFTGIFSKGGDDLSFKLYSDSIKEENLMLEHVIEADKNHDVIKRSVLKINGQDWVIEYYDTSKLYGSFDYTPIIAIVAAGVTITTLTSGVVLVLRSSTKRAYGIANDMTKDIRENQDAAKRSAERSKIAEVNLKKTQASLLTQNEHLKDSKRAMLNILEDLDSERDGLTQARAKDDAILQGIADALVVVDANGVTQLVNHSFENLMGMKSASLVGKKYADVLAMYDGAGNKVPSKERLVNKSLETGENIVTSTGDSYFYEKKDKNLLAVSISVAAIKVGGKTIGAVELFRDITKEREVDKAKTEFVSLASHQLRTPLSTINWYAEMLLEGDAGKVNDEQKKYLEEIYTGNKRMTDLVGALLNVSRVDLGTFAIEPEPTDVVALTKRTVQDLEPRIFKRQIDFTEEYDKEIPTMNVDPKLMRMVIENLCTNAVKYTQEGGKVKMTMKMKDDKVTIAVADNGYGIPAKQHDKIFSKLFRADNIKSQDTEGTGLGLYLVKSIVEYTSGKIWFESAENKGTTFFVELPAHGMKEKTGSKQLD